MAMMSFKEIILASASPRRHHLLAQMGVRFRVQAADVEEDHAVACPQDLVRCNAQLKAEWVAQRNPEGLVLGADTTVALGDVIFNKPADMEEARYMLEQLSGQTHVVYTGVAVVAWAAGIAEQQVVRSEVTFQVLSAAKIEKYFAMVNPLDKAGAYGIQEGKELIIASLHGSLNNVMGLPTEYLQTLFAEQVWGEGLLN